MMEKMYLNLIKVKMKLIYSKVIEDNSGNKFSLIGSYEVDPNWVSEQNCIFSLANTTTFMTNIYVLKLNDNISDSSKEINIKLQKQEYHVNPLFK